MILWKMLVLDLTAMEVHSSHGLMLACFSSVFNLQVILALLN